MLIIKGSSPLFLIITIVPNNAYLLSFCDGSSCQRDEMRRSSLTVDVQCSYFNNW